MQAMVLAAGLGTRLRPLTEERPKPAVPVANRPLGLYTVDALIRAGTDAVAINTHHLPDVLETQLLSRLPTGLTVERSNEPELLGTGGGVRRGWNLLDPGRPLVVMNSDILFAPDVRAVFEQHRESGAVATMVLRPDAGEARYGLVEIDGEGVVRRLPARPGSEPHGSEAGLCGYVFTGLHVLSARAFSDLPERGCIIRSAYDGWLARGEVAAVVDRSSWRDLGTLRDYLEANVDLAAGRLTWDGVEPGGHGSIVHPTATVAAGASIAGSVVGPSARVEQGVHVEESVIWAGARVAADVRRSVVTPLRLVPVDS